MTAMDYRDNALGRFNSIDALAEASYSFSPFTFSNNNPIFWSDPSGLLSQTFINSLIANSDVDKATKWINDGGGTFSKENGSGIVDQETGEYTGFDTLKAVTITGKKTHNGLGSRLEGNLGGLAQSKAYSFGKFYEGWRSNFRTKQFDELQDGLDWLGTIPGFGEPVDFINAGISGIRGDYTRAGLSLAAMVPIGGALATVVKIQKHHIIPRAVYRDASKVVKEALELDGVFNLKRLPTPFHGNHPQYNTFVRNQLRDLKNVTPGSIKALQKDLNSMINKAYDNYKVTGENLNDYFRQFNID